MITAKTLRSLARDYANGILNKDAYRQSRDEFLAGVITGEIPLIVNDYRAPLPEQEPDLDSTFEKTEIRPAPSQKTEETTTEFVAPPLSSRHERTTSPVATEQPDSSPSKHYMLAAAAIIGIAILVFAIPVLMNDDQTGISQITTMDADRPQPAAVQQNKSGTELIDEFLNQRNWSDENLQQFTEKWNSLDPEEQTNGLASSSSVQLTNAIYKQLLEERTLFGTGNFDAIMARQQTLVNFAHSIGINDPRLKVREIDPELLAPSTDSSISNQ